MFSILRRIRRSLQVLLFPEFQYMVVQLRGLDSRVKNLEDSTLANDVEDLQIALDELERAIESSTLGNDVEELRTDVDHLMESVADL